MNICNKSHNKIVPEDLGEAVPEVKAQRARRNGWSWPLHLFQIIAWLLFLFFALVGFGILVPLLPRHWVPVGYIVSLDPEENMGWYKLSLRGLTELVRWQRKHGRKAPEPEYFSSVWDLCIKD